MIYEKTVRARSLAEDDRAGKQDVRKQAFLLAAFIIYCLFVVWMTVLKREPMLKRRIVMELFWSYRSWIDGEKKGGRAVIQNIENVLFFIPFGALFPWKQKKWMGVLLCAITVSLSIEIIQYVFMLGWCELDDLICNSLGAILGFQACVMIKKRAKGRYASDTRTWSEEEYE